MRLLPVLTLAAVLAAQSQAMAEEADLSTPIAKAPDVTLRDLVPAAILDGVSNPFGLQAEVMSNEADNPFHATFDITLPDYPDVTITLLVSERENVTGLMARIASMAESGNLPGGSAADTDVLDGLECVGVVDQNMISCTIGTAGVQFTATDYLDGDSIDYAAARALFVTLSLESYLRAFGR